MRLECVHKDIRLIPNANTDRALTGLGRFRLAQGQHDEAEDFFKQGTETGNRELPGKGHPWTLRNVNGLAVLRTRQKQYEEAEPLLIEAIQGRRLKLGYTHPHTLESWKNLIDLYEAWNKPEEAAKWRARLPQTEAAKQQHRTPKTPPFSVARGCLTR